MLEGNTDYLTFIDENFENYIRYSYMHWKPHTAPSEVIFYHIFKNVLKQVNDSNIMKALDHAKIRDVFELIDLSG